MDETLAEARIEGLSRTEGHLQAERTGARSRPREAGMPVCQVFQV